MISMKARELRLNNYVWENYGGAYIVRGILDRNTIEISKTEKTISVPFNIDELRPIPLTEDWLLRLGFELGRFNYLTIKTVNCCSINKKYFDKDLITLDIDGNSIPLQNIKTVHQLQNLYFALTGEELTLKT